MSTESICEPPNTVTDIESGNGGETDYESVDVGVDIEEAVEAQIVKFEISLQKCDERLGVMLLLDYQRCLDDVNECYQNLINYMCIPRYEKVTYKEQMEAFSTSKHIALPKLSILTLGHGGDEAYKADVTLYFSQGTGTIRRPSSAGCEAEEFSRRDKRKGRDIP